MIEQKLNTSTVLLINNSILSFKVVELFYDPAEKHDYEIKKAKKKVNKFIIPLLYSNNSRKQKELIRNKETYNCLTPFLNTGVKSEKNFTLDTNRC